VLKKPVSMQTLRLKHFTTGRLKIPSYLIDLSNLQLSPIFKARKAIVGALETNLTLALKYLEKKLKTEFGDDKETIETDNKIDSVTIEVIRTYQSW
jgi:hypothetical protein